VYFALVGALREAVDAFLLINARYTEPDPLLKNLSESVDELFTAYGLSTWLIVAGSVALVVLPLAFARQQRRPENRPAAVLAAFALALVTGLLWNIKDYDAWPDLFPLLPLAAVGVGGVFAWATHRFSHRSTFLVALVLLVATTTTAVHAAVTTRDNRLLTQRESVEGVFDVLPPSATITSIEAPQPLVLDRRTNPTRYQMFSGGMHLYVDDHWPGGLRAFRQRLVDEPTTLVALGETMSQTWRDGLTPQYEYIGRAPGWLWYADTSLGETTLSALRKAAGSYSSDAPTQTLTSGAHVG
jgi:hypothetical protein